MSLLKGGISPKRFEVLGAVPSEAQILKGLDENRFRPFEDGTEEERFGWADWRNPLITPPEPEWVQQDRFMAFALRIDTRKVSSTRLNAMVNLRLAGLMKDRDLAFVGKEARISIQDEVKLELLRKEQPKIKCIELAWDLKKGHLIACGASTKQVGVLANLFTKSFGVELQPIVPLVLAGKLVPAANPERLLGIEPFQFAEVAS